MARFITLALALITVFGSSESLPNVPHPETQVRQIEHFEGARDVDPGEPRNHTTCTCAPGSFVGVPGAAMYSRSPLFAGEPVPVVARFSLAGGDATKASGVDRNARSMLLAFRLPDGSLQQVSLISGQEFSSAAPSSLLYKRPNAKDVRAFVGGRADSLGRALAEYESTAGYADEVYYDIRILKLVNRADKATFARWRFIPQDGEMTRSDPTSASTPGTVLEQAFIKRTRQGPVRWDMLVTLGEPSDSEGDLPIRWPATREELHLGTLTIWSTMPQKGAGCREIIHDPPLLGDGIASLRDP
jgi:catalase